MLVQLLFVFFVEFTSRYNMKEDETIMILDILFSRALFCLTVYYYIYTVFQCDYILLLIDMKTCDIHFICCLTIINVWLLVSVIRKTELVIYINILCIHVKFEKTGWRNQLRKAIRHFTWLVMLIQVKSCKIFLEIL